MLGTTDAARYLELSVSTLTYWRKSGVLIPTHVRETPNGPRYRYSTADLDKFRSLIYYNV